MSQCVPVDVFCWKLRCGGWEWCELWLLSRSQNAIILPLGKCAVVGTLELDIVAKNVLLRWLTTAVWVEIIKCNFFHWCCLLEDGTKVYKWQSHVCRNWHCDCWNCVPVVKHSECNPMTAGVLQWSTSRTGHKSSYSVPLWLLTVAEWMIAKQDYLLLHILSA